MCENCILERTRVSVSGSLPVTVCPKCGSIMIGNRWYRDQGDLPLVSRISQLCTVSDPHFHPEIEKDSMDMNLDEQNVRFLVTVCDGSEFRSAPVQLEAKLSILKNSCPSCNRLSGSYYESIIQIRSFSRKYSPIIDDAVKTVNDYLSTEKLRGKNPFISKQQRLKEGFDLFLGSKSDGEKIARMMHDKYFSELVQNKKLAGRTEGYDLYRYTYLLRIMDLPRGAILQKRGEKFVLLSITGDGITLMNTGNRKIQRIRQNEFNANPFQFMGETLTVKHYIVISHNSSETEIMDPDSFAETTVRGVYTGQELTGFEMDGEVVIPRED